jgi:hypothetical protein
MKTGVNTGQNNMKFSRTGSNFVAESVMKINGGIEMLDDWTNVPISGLILEAPTINDSLESTKC